MPRRQEVVKTDSDVSTTREPSHLRGERARSHYLGEVRRHRRADPVIGEDDSMLMFLGIRYESHVLPIAVLKSRAD